MSRGRPFNFSVVLGGPEPGISWKASLDVLYVAMDEVQADIVADITLALLWDVPGSVTTPNFAGVRVGRYWKKDHLLAVDVALPVREADDPLGFLVSQLWLAIEAGRAWAEDKNAKVDLAVHEAVLRRLERRVSRWID